MEMNEIKSPLIAGYSIPPGGTSLDILQQTLTESVSVDGEQQQESSPSDTSTSTDTLPGTLPEFEFPVNDWSWQQRTDPAAALDPTPADPNILAGYTLSVIRQPEEQHRARYLSEGSRGAIKDRSGTSNCTLQLTGFYRPTRVEMFAATGTDQIAPHTLYRLIPVSGKSANVTPCRKMTAHDGIECLEIVLRPETSMTAVLDCVGILKICSYDAKQRKRFHGNSGGPHSEVRIAFRAYIPLEGQANAFTVVETQSEPIRCVQQLGVPEVLKMSLNTSPARGGGDLFIIGRNFDRNTVVVFREYKDDGTLAWNAEATIDKQYLHQCHIVCQVPTYHNLYRGGSVSVTVRCGQKSSHPSNFVYTPTVSETYDEWRPPSSPQYVQNAGYFEEYNDFMPPTSNGLMNSCYHSASGDCVNASIAQKFAMNQPSCYYEFDHQSSNQKLYSSNTTPVKSPDMKKQRIQIFRQSPTLS